MKRFFCGRRTDWIMLGVWSVIGASLFLLPAPFPAGTPEGRSYRAEVLETDDSALQKHGLLHFGSQLLRVKILEGPWRGEERVAVNELRAQMELDKHFTPGDKAVVAIPSGNAGTVTAQDHDRHFPMIVLFAAFCVLLAVFGGMVGIKALASFVFSCIVIWRGVIPLLLAGMDPLGTIFGAVALLTFAILFLVAGFCRKGWAAFSGAMLGVFFGFAVARACGMLLKINGATLPYAQTLYYSGYDFIDLGELFAGAMILASSGAVMDLAMDIASGVEEVAFHHPGLPKKALFFSGIRIGRSVVGTMTTTLLLAYSGGYVTLLMMFFAQGTPPWNFINNPLVAAEIAKTLVGSFALVLVAPFTAWTAACLLGGPKKSTSATP